MIKQPNPGFGTLRRARLVLPALGLVTVVALTGCGGSDSTPLNQAPVGESQSAADPSSSSPDASGTSDVSGTPGGSSPSDAASTSSASDTASGPAGPAGAPASSPPRAKPAASKTSSSRSRSAAPANQASLRKACAAVDAVFQDFVKQDSEHVNDPKGAAPVFISTAARLRKVSAGTPIEKETAQLAATMQRMGKELAAGTDDGSDTKTLGKALKPLAKVCGPAMK